MTTYDKAYCPQYKEKDKNISAETANKEVINRKLKNPKFYCGEKCNVELTCINLHVDRKKEPNRMKPYYSERIKGQVHSSKCERKKKFVKSHSGTKAQKDTYYFNNNELIFNFDISDGLNVTNNDGTKSQPAKQNYTGTTNSVSKNNFRNSIVNKQNRIFQTSDLDKIVDLFETYKLYNLANDFPKIYDKNRKEISFDEIFKVIQGCKIDNEKYFIYHGQAHALKFKNSDGLILRFTGKEAQLAYVEAKPSVIIWKDNFEKNGKKGVYEDLQKYANKWKENKFKKDSYFELYFLGKFLIDETGKYINFDTHISHFPKYIVIRPNA